MDEGKTQYSDAVSSVEEIIDDARNGRMFILVDHEDRENEGDLVIPAQMATPAAANFLAPHGRGLLCLALPPSMNEDGTMARLPDLVAFAQRHGLKIGTISDLIAYRRRNDNLVRATAERRVTSEFGGDWTMRIYTDETEGAEHVMLIKGDISGDAPVLVRMHTLDPMLDVIGLGTRGRTGEFADAMRLIAAEGRGVLVLLRDIHAKIVSDGEVSPQTLRQYGLGAQILSSLGLHRLILLTNSPTPRIVGLEAYGLEIAGPRRIPME